MELVNKAVNTVKTDKDVRDGVVSGVVTTGLLGLMGCKMLGAMLVGGTVGVLAGFTSKLVDEQLNKKTTPTK